VRQSTQILRLQRTLRLALSYEFKVKDIAQYLNMQPGAVSVAIAKGRELAASAGPARNYN